MGRPSFSLLDVETINGEATDRGEGSMMVNAQVDQQFTKTASSDVKPSLDEGGVRVGKKTIPNEVSLEDLDRSCVLGKGNQGVVELAIHKVTKVNYALKMIPANQDKGKSITAELSGAVDRSSEYVVHTYGVYRTRKHVWICLEFMDGGNLQEMYTDHPHPIPESALASLAQQLLRGLAYLKSRHVMHRDIKPVNLLLKCDGSAKLADFGVSASLDNTMGTAHSYVGSRTYMSPERIRGNGYKAVSEVWSLGLALLECANGEYPYPRDQTKSYFDFLHHVVNMPVPVPSESYSDSFKDLMLQMMEKKADLRHSSETLLNHPFIIHHAGTPEKEAQAKNALKMVVATSKLNRRARRKAKRKARAAAAAKKTTVKKTSVSRPAVIPHPTTSVDASLQRMHLH